MAGATAFDSAGNDGFKIALTTGAPVHEPASWAIMIMGMVAFALRGYCAADKAKTAPARA